MIKNTMKIQDSLANLFLNVTLIAIGILLLVPSLTSLTKDAKASDPSIYESAEATTDLSTLKSLIDLANLDTTLDDCSADFTVFAPVNSAFSSLPEGVVEALVLAENRDALTDILTYHVVAGAALSTDLTDGQELTTLQGATLTVGIDGPTVTLTDELGRESTVTTADVSACNGVVHIVDNVVLDKEYSFEEENLEVTPTLVEYLVGTDKFDTLVSALEAAELVTELSEASENISVLAPTNEAFSSLPADVLESLLLPENKDKLQDILRYHVVLLPSLGDLQDGQVLQTLNGDTLTVIVNEDGQFIRDALGNTARISLSSSSVDGSSFQIASGSVYEIDAVLLPEVEAAAEPETLEDTGINLILISLIAVVSIFSAFYVVRKLDWEI